MVMTKLVERFAFTTATLWEDMFPWSALQVARISLTCVLVGRHDIWARGGQCFGTRMEKKTKTLILEKLDSE